jgi:hypothetical protein
MSSYQDKLATASATVRRKLFDHSVRMKGRLVSVSRFYVEEDLYGDEQRSLIRRSDVEMIIVYPPGEVPLQRFRKDATQAAVEETGTFFFDILPIEVFVQFKDNVEKGDFIFQVIKDENHNKMGILLQISNMFGSWDTELVWRKGWAAPYSGDVPPEVQTAINELLD